MFAAQQYEALERIEDFASTVARAFDAGAQVELGAPKRTRLGRFTFQICGEVGGRRAYVEFIVPRGIRARSAWVTWAYALEHAGHAVAEDPTYGAAVLAGVA
jgi:hypothetical protein